MRFAVVFYIQDREFGVAAQIGCYFVPEKCGVGQQWNVDRL